MPAGTLMAYCVEEGMVGSLSGGCIEEDLLHKMKNGTLPLNPQGRELPIEMIYGDSEEQQKRFLLPCGGQLHLLIEPLLPDSLTIQHFQSLKLQLAKREIVKRTVCLKTSSRGVSHTEVKRGIRRVKTDDSYYIEHGMGPDYQMLLIGASEVARCVAELALGLDFKVSVWDHRSEFIRNWQVAGVEVYSGSPEKLIGENFSDQNNAIIALAHDPRVDDFALVDALATEAFYIGAIGSMKTCQKRNQRLINYLDDTSCLDKLHSPVGVKIGSKTPYEIAISILAEVILKRSQLT